MLRTWLSKVGSGATVLMRKFGSRVAVLVCAGSGAKGVAVEVAESDINCEGNEGV